MGWYDSGMRPLLHPAINDITVAGILHALSDPVRVAIYAELASASGATTCSHFLNVRDRNIPKSTLSQHFKALREAGLVRSERNGVALRNISRCAEIERRFPGLIPAILNAHRCEATGQAGTARRRARGTKSRTA
jgi:DNA-binding transcriptional ArsR family regulator